jgi:hypothetical protein
VPRHLANGASVTREEFHRHVYLPALRARTRERVYLYGPLVIVALAFLALAVLVGHRVI